MMITINWLSFALKSCFDLVGALQAEGGGSLEGGTVGTFFGHFWLEMQGQWNQYDPSMETPPKLLVSLHGGMQRKTPQVPFHPNDSTKRHWSVDVTE